jgi:hypothetical protein
VCRCHPEYATTHAQGKICIPKVFNMSCTECVGDYKCLDDVCKCPLGYTPGKDFTCKVSVGRPCNKRSECDVGVDCSVSGICTTTSDTPCNPLLDTPSTPQCSTARLLICDRFIHRCRVRPGRECSSSWPCVTDTICDKHDGICRIRRGEPCDDYPQWCETRYECAVRTGKVCLLKNGKICDNTETSRCQEDAICEEDVYGVCRCKQDILKPCSFQKLCRRLAECHSVLNKCTWILGSHCEANQHDTCGPGRICDLDGICKIKPGPESCTRTPEFCQLRSICNPQGVCECLVSVAEKSEGCPEKPGTNRTFSNCTPPTDPGMVTGMQCVNAGNASCDNATRTCRCLEEFLPVADLTCRPDIGLPCVEKLPTQLFMTILVPNTANVSKVNVF